jgi:proteasome lid subunit RPN8/RPN11
MSLTDTVLADIRAHAEREYPRESCGLVIIVRGRRRYIPCRNIALRNEHFVMHPQDYAAAEETGAIIMVVHSHPNLPAVPSEADLVGCERSGVPWLIISWPTGTMHEFSPTGYKAPLIGRQFHHGVLDCYSLIEDYYAQELGIVLPEFERGDEWWLKGENLYLQGFAQAGFVRVDELTQHDVLLIQVASPVPNHGAIFLGDGCILHHQMHRLSSRDVYGGWYRKCTTHILRHRSRM